MSTEFTIFKDLRDMIAAPAGVATPVVMYKTEDGVLAAYGTTVPTTASTYAKGCVFYKVNGTNGNVQYINVGSYASPDFQQVLTGGVAAVADDGGLSPLIWDDADVLGAILNPVNGYHFFTHLDEGDVTTAASLWTQTNRTSISFTNGVEPGGVVILDAGAANAAQGGTIQMHGVTVTPAAGRTIRMEWRVKVDEDDGRLVMGLGAVGTTDWVSDDSIVVNADCAMFLRDDGTTATKWSTQICDGSSAQETADVFTSDDGYETFGIVIVGNGATATDSVTFYHNGVAAGTVTDVADMPDAAMVPTFESNADGTDQPVMVLDWLKILVTDSSIPSGS